MFGAQITELFQKDTIIPITRTSIDPAAINDAEITELKQTIKSREKSYTTEIQGIQTKTKAEVDGLKAQIEQLQQQLEEAQVSKQEQLKEQEVEHLQKVRQLEESHMQEIQQYIAQVDEANERLAQVEKAQNKRASMDQQQSRSPAPALEEENIKLKSRISELEQANEDQEMEFVEEGEHEYRVRNSLTIHSVKTQNEFQVEHFTPQKSPEKRAAK